MLGDHLIWKNISEYLTNIINECQWTIIQLMNNKKIWLNNNNNNNNNATIMNRNDIIIVAKIYY